MPPSSHTLAEEGAAIQAFKLVSKGKFQVLLNHTLMSVNIGPAVCAIRS